LRFRHWAAFGSYDTGRVQIRYETAPVAWSAWEELASYTSSSGEWTYPIIDISSYAGEKVEIAFFVDQGVQPTWNHSYVGLGWHIDDFLLEVEQNVTTILTIGNTYSKNFSDSWSNWWADNSIWEVGLPTSGPEDCFSGSSCIATNLEGNYADYNESHLISPKIQLPAIGPDEEIQLRFRHWAAFGSYDTGRVQIRHETDPGAWSAWEKLAAYSSSSGEWSYPLIDISSHAGEKVEIAFFIDQGVQPTWNHSYVGLGWYIDDITVEAK